MNDHKELLKEADELFDNLKKKDRERMVFRWSYVGNRELGRLETIIREVLLPRLGRIETVFYSVIAAGILGLLIAKALGS